MKIKGIKAGELDAQKFINDKIDKISKIVGNEFAINALSGGVDSATVTMLGNWVLGKRLKTVFVENGLMREGESEQVEGLFRQLGRTIEVIDARKEFFIALKGITDPEEKREAITQTFYRNVFGRIIKKSGAKYLLQGTILTDVDETVAGIKRQHNVFEQLGIDPQKSFGYHILEPLIQLRKDGVRIIAKALGLPESVYNRPPFPGPALATRVKGAITPDKIEMVRQATVITEEALEPFGAFQNMAILNEDRVTGIIDGKRAFGRQIEIRCWDSFDATEATPKELPYQTMRLLGERIPAEVPGVVGVTFNFTSKPPLTMEAL
ncbi:MAG: ExsB family transcriptional regulator [Patescibacteria group bacterium]|nr:ExsB family transcriptional regulator [Patescibacteria group bacterium]